MLGSLLFAFRPILEVFVHSSMTFLNMHIISIQLQRGKWDIKHLNKPLFICTHPLDTNPHSVKWLSSFGREAKTVKTVHWWPTMHNAWRPIAKGYLSNTGDLHFFLFQSTCIFNLIITELLAITIFVETKMSHTISYHLYLIVPISKHCRLVVLGVNLHVT